MLPVLALVMVLATAGLVVAMLTGGGHSVHLGGGGGEATPSAEATGGSLSGTGQGTDTSVAPPQAVTGLTATPNGKEIRWGWDIPQQGQYQATELACKYLLTRPGEAVVAETMRRNSLTTSAVSGENCLTVSVVVEATGRESAPVTQCVTVP